MKYFKEVLIFCALIFPCGCSDKKYSQEDTHQLSVHEESITVEIKEQKVTGKVRDTKFSIDQAILENGSLKLKQGKDYFSDVEVKIITFYHGDISEKIFKADGSALSFKPHIILSIKREKEGVPDEVTIVDDYELQLEFGKKENLGIPFSIKFMSLKNGTSVEGKSFASFKDIMVIGNVIDVQYDSFDTLDLLASEYIKTQIKDVELGKRFGLTYTSYEEDYPKAGFVGFEVSTAANKQSVIKIQLAKDVNGWKVVRQLESNQIHEAHPALEYIGTHLRTVEGVKAKAVAAKKLELYLNEQALIENIRATNVSCYLTKDARKSSCNAVYGLKVDGDVECHQKNYLLKNDGGEWKFESDILNTQKVDYSSGELVSYEPFSISCE